MGHRVPRAPIWFAIRLAILAAAGCGGTTEAPKDGATAADTGVDAAAGAGGSTGGNGRGGAGGPGTGGGGDQAGTAATGGTAGTGGTTGSSGRGGAAGGAARGGSGGGATGGTAGAGGGAGASGSSGRGGSGAGGTGGAGGRGGSGGSSGGRGGSGTAGTGGAGGQPAVCREIELEYASRLPRFLNCSSQNQCGNRAAMTPGCPCQIPVQEPAPLELEMLFNLEFAWFDAGCTMPAAPCPATCSTNRGMACQSGRCVSVP